MSESIVSCRDLKKSYGALVALNELNLELSGGRIIGLLGPNGSGKTTLIKLLAGLLTPTSGSLSVGGFAPGIETRAMVSYLPERTYFNSWMTVNDCITYFADFYADFDEERARKMLETLDVDTARKLKTLSKGTKEKVQLVMVMARRAKLYVLDEPIAGVDPAARDFILDTVISAREPDSAVLISTHLISDVENVLDEYIFLKNGTVMESGTVEQVKAQFGTTLDEHFREVFRCFANS